MNINQFKIIQHTEGSRPNLTDYVYLLDTKTKKKHPIKRINTEFSKFSKARWLKKDSPIIKNFEPKLSIEPDIRGEVQYHVFNNTIVIPGDLSFCSTIQ